MVVFLANRANLQTKRLHDRIRTRLGSEFEDVHRRRTEPREPGQYRVVGVTNPQHYVENSTYPVTEARIEVGFRLETGTSYEFFWINWIEPTRNVVIGWHQDGTHDDLGPVHLQVSEGKTVVDHKSAEFIDAHPLAVLDRRLETLEPTVESVVWEDDQPVRFRTD